MTEYILRQDPAYTHPAPTTYLADQEKFGFTYTHNQRCAKRFATPEAARAARGESRSWQVVRLKPKSGGWHDRALDAEERLRTLARRWLVEMQMECSCDYVVGEDGEEYGPAEKCMICTVEEILTGSRVLEEVDAEWRKARGKKHL